MSDDEEIIYEGDIPLKAFLLSHSLPYLIPFGWNIGLLSSLLKTAS